MRRVRVVDFCEGTDAERRHLVLKRTAPWKAALATPIDKYRITFALPWEDMLLLGTTDEQYEGDPADVAVKLRAVFRPADDGLAAGNTHLHLMKLSPEDADTYLKLVPAADGLRVMFISYLERHKDDATYVTNRYPVGELPQFRATGVLFRF